MVHSIVKILTYESAIGAQTNLLIRPDIFGPCGPPHSEVLLQEDVILQNLGKGCVLQSYYNNNHQYIIVPLYRLSTQDFVHSL